MVPNEERRRFHRLVVTLPVEFTVIHPETEERYQGEGMLRDFSLGGAFFYPVAPPPLQPGQVLLLTIITPLATLCSHDSNCIQAQGRVVRLEEHTREKDCLGVAVAFLEFPRFLFLSGSPKSLS